MQKPLLQRVPLAHRRMQAREPRRKRLRRVTQVDRAQSAVRSGSVNASGSRAYPGLILEQAEDSRFSCIAENRKEEKT